MESDEAFAHQSKEFEREGASQFTKRVVVVMTINTVKMSFQHL